MQTKIERWHNVKTHTHNQVKVKLLAVKVIRRYRKVEGQKSVSE